MKNLEIIAQSMIDNGQDYCEVNSTNLILGSFYENGKDVIYLCDTNGECNMDKWIKIQRIK